MSGLGLKGAHKWMNLRRTLLCEKFRKKLQDDPSLKDKSLKMSWSNWGFGIEPLEKSAARLRKAELLVDMGMKEGAREKLAQSRAIVDAVLAQDADGGRDGVAGHSRSHSPGCVSARRMGKATARNSSVGGRASK